MKTPRYGYNEKGEVEDEEITFTVKVTCRKRWASQLVGFFKRLQYLGDIGSSRGVTILGDGDGDFRPDFEIDGKPIKESDIPAADPVRDEDLSAYFDAG